MSDAAAARTTSSAPPQPLAGRRVVELSQFIAGPTCAMHLADYGAEVIKIESAAGDRVRTLPGTVHGSVYARSFNAGKTSRVLDLRGADGAAALDDLLAGADAFVCNLAPATLRTMRLDGPSLRERHPHLVATLISGYGQHDDRTCMDTIAQCESGYAIYNGAADGSPRLSTGWPVDTFTGLYAALATAMALQDPARRGCIVDLSMMEVAVATMLGPAVLTVAEGETLAPPCGNRDRASSPSGIYRCADGDVYVLGGLDAYWRRLQPLVGGPDAPIAERIARAAEFDARVEAWTSARPRDEVLSTMASLQIPVGVVRTPADAIAAIRAARPGAVSTALPSGEHVPAAPVLFDGRRLPRDPAPAIGGARRRGADASPAADGCAP